MLALFRTWCAALRKRWGNNLTSWRRSLGFLSKCYILSWCELKYPTVLFLDQWHRLYWSYQWKFLSNHRIRSLGTCLVSNLEPRSQKILLVHLLQQNPPGTLRVAISPSAEPSINHHTSQASDSHRVLKSWTGSRQHWSGNQPPDACQPPRTASFVTHAPTSEGTLQTLDSPPSAVANDIVRIFPAGCHGCRWGRCCIRRKFPALLVRSERWRHPQTCTSMLCLQRWHREARFWGVRRTV